MADHQDYCLQEYKYRYQRDLLSGRVAVITGGGSGIGFRIAELFMRHGCDTVLASRKLEKLEQVRECDSVSVLGICCPTLLVCWEAGECYGTKMCCCASRCQKGVADLLGVGGAVFDSRVYFVCSMMMLVM